MNRIIIAGSLVIGLGLFGTTAMGQPQNVLKQRKKLPSKLVVKPLPYDTKLNPQIRDMIGPSAALNEPVRKYAESKKGNQVGNGECWTLVDEALKNAGARQPGQGGFKTYEFGKTFDITYLRPGDILQFEGVVFKGRTANGGTYTNNFPHHTAIVNKVNGKQIELLHQNINGDRRVQTGTINLADLQSGGTIVPFRPMPR